MVGKVRPEVCLLATLSMNAYPLPACHSAD